MVSAVLRGAGHGGVVTTSDPDLAVGAVLRDVLRHGVRLQAFTGVPQGF